MDRQPVTPKTATVELSYICALLKPQWVGGPFTKFSHLSPRAKPDYPEALCFANTKRFAIEASAHKDTHGILLGEKLWGLAEELAVEKTCICVADGKYALFMLHNTLCASGAFYPKPNGFKSSETSRIADSAHIHPCVSYGRCCVVGETSVLGGEDLEAYRFGEGYVTAEHDAGLVMGEGVYVGHGTVINRGIFQVNTEIGSGCKIGNKVVISHCAKLGANVFVASGANICGSVQVEDGAWIGPGAVISNGVSIGRNARVSLGAVVVQDVPPGETVSGNFAMPHMKFMLKNFVR